MSAKQRIVAPRSSNEFIAGDGPVGQDAPREMSVTGPATITDPVIEPVTAEALRNKDKLDKLKFMDEPVTVLVHPSSDKNAKPYLELFVNGIRQNVARGANQTIKRKYVEVLARMKLTSYVTQTPIEEGEARNVITPSTGLVAPFSVLHDPSGARGAAWLSEVLAEA